MFLRPRSLLRTGVQSRGSSSGLRIIDLQSAAMVFTPPGPQGSDAPDAAAYAAAVAADADGAPALLPKLRGVLNALATSRTGVVAQCHGPEENLGQDAATASPPGPRLSPSATAVTVAPRSLPHSRSDPRAPPSRAP